MLEEIQFKGTAATGDPRWGRDTPEGLELWVTRARVEGLPRDCGPWRNPRGSGGNK